MQPPAVAAGRRGREVARLHSHGELWVCVLRNGALHDQLMWYGATSGDTMTVEGLPISTAYPLTAEYASVAGWYVNDEPIVFMGRRFVKHGLPRVLGSKRWFPWARTTAWPCS